jgi:hypothetical protein
MKREEHCRECRKKMGDDWEKVHIWLDETAGAYFPWCGHRQIRHHTKGVEEVRRMWGDEAATAAEMHIISDEGYVPTKLEIRERYGPSPYIEDRGAYPRFPHDRRKDWDGVKEFN